MLNPYMDIGNYERAQNIIKHTRILKKKKVYTKGLSIVILNLNRPDLIIPLIKELLKAKNLFAKESFDIEILIGDTGSSDPTVLSAYKEFSSDIKVFSNMKYNFSRCNNQIFEQLVSYQYTLFLNNDIVFTDAHKNLSMMLEQLKNNFVGIVGSYLFFPNDNVQHIGIDFFQDGEAKSLCYHPFHNKKINLPIEIQVDEVSAVTGACLMIRSDLFYTIDGFDENYEEECQDVHLCLSVKRLGYTICSVYSGNIKHLENATRPKNSENWKDRRYFLRKWQSYIEVL